MPAWGPSAQGQRCVCSGIHCPGSEGCSRHPALALRSSRGSSLSSVWVQHNQRSSTATEKKTPSLPHCTAQNIPPKKPLGICNHRGDPTTFSGQSQAAPAQEPHKPYSSSPAPRHPQQPQELSPSTAQQPPAKGVL